MTKSKFSSQPLVSQEMFMNSLSRNVLKQLYIND